MEKRNLENEALINYKDSNEKLLESPQQVIDDYISSVNSFMIKGKQLLVMIRDRDEVSAKKLDYIFEDTTKKLNQLKEFEIKNVCIKVPECMVKLAASVGPADGASVGAATGAALGAICSPLDAGICALLFAIIGGVAGKLISRSGLQLAPLLTSIIVNTNEIQKYVALIHIKKKV